MGALITIVPVGVVQLGCTVAEAVGVAIEGTALMVKAVPLEVQPVGVFFTVTI